MTFTFEGRNITIYNQGGYQYANGPATTGLRLTGALGTIDFWNTNFKWKSATTGEINSRNANNLEWKSSLGKGNFSTCPTIPVEYNYNINWWVYNAVKFWCALGNNTVNFGAATGNFNYPAVDPGNLVYVEDHSVPVTIDAFSSIPGVPTHYNLRLGDALP